MLTVLKVLIFTFWVLLGYIGQSAIVFGDTFDYRSVLTLPASLQNQPSIFKNTMGIAFGPDGSRWIAATAPSNVQHFNAQGGYLGKIIADLYTITVAPDGSLWGLELDRLDGYKTVAKHYSAQGQLLHQFKVNTEFRPATDIASAADGSVWVLAERFLHHFSADGKTLATMSAENTGTAAIWSSFALAADGSVWINSTTHILHYHNSGQLLTSIPKPDAVYLHGIAVAKDGSLWIAGDDASFYHIKADGSLIAKFTANFGTPINGFNRLAIAADGSIWMVGAQYLQQLQTDGQIRFHSSGTFQPASPIADPDGSLWIADINNQTIRHITTSGQLLDEAINFSECMPNKRFAPETLSYQRQLAQAADGSLWVMDSYNARTRRFGDESRVDTCLRHIDRKGKLLHAFSLSANVEMFRSWWTYTPNSVFSIAPDGRLGLVRASQNRLEYFSPEGIKQGEVLGEAIDENSGHYGFTDISSLKFAADGSIWLTHSVYNGQIQHLDKQGRLIHQFLGGLLNNRYTDLALASDGSVWLANQYGGAIEHFNVQGDYLEQIDIPDSFSSYYHPEGIFSIAVNKAGAVWLVDAKEPSQMSGFDSVPRLQKLESKSALRHNAEYDASARWARLIDVVVDGKPYHATLKQYLTSQRDGTINQSYTLTSLNPTKENNYSPTAHYELATGLLTIPHIKVGDEVYRAELQGVFNKFGRWEFALKTAVLIGSNVPF